MLNVERKSCETLKQLKAQNTRLKDENNQVNRKAAFTEQLVFQRLFQPSEALLHSIVG